MCLVGWHAVFQSFWCRVGASLLQNLCTLELKTDIGDGKSETASLVVGVAVRIEQLDMIPPKNSAHVASLACVITARPSVRFFEPS